MENEAKNFQEQGAGTRVTEAYLCGTTTKQAETRNAAAEDFSSFNND